VQQSVYIIFIRLFVVGLVEYDIYLGLFLLLSHSLNLAGHKRILLCAFSFSLMHILQHHHDDFINKIFGWLHVELNGS
jgi:hypothetical protein